MDVRQAAEKAWLSVVEATDAYLLKHNIRVNAAENPHMERRRHLRQLNRDEWARTYSDLSQTLHGELFYFGEDITPDLLRRYFLEAAQFVDNARGGGGELYDETHQALWSPDLWKGWAGRHNVRRV